MSTSKFITITLLALCAATVSHGHAAVKFRHIRISEK